MGSIRPRLALGFATLTGATSAWIVVPAPVHALLPLAVGAPEISLWLALSALSSIAIATSHLNVPAARIAVVMGLLALAPPLWVLASIPGTMAAFDVLMSDAIGPPSAAAGPSGGERPPTIRLLPMLTGLPTADIRVVRHVEFARHQDGVLALDVYRRNDDVVWPVVVQIYGGGWRSGAAGDNEPLARALADAGYVVVAIDYRHAPRWTWPAQLEDVRAALEWVRRHAGEYGGDSGRVALLGRSSGAQLALIGGITDATLPVRAIVAFYSPVNLIEGYRNPGFPDTLGIRELETSFIGGTPEEKPEAYRDASPLTYGDRPHPPVLLINGGRDRIVYPAYGAALHDRLRRSGTSVFLVIPWANHAFDAVPFGPSAQLGLSSAERFLAWAMRRQ